MRYLPQRIILTLSLLGALQLSAPPADARPGTKSFTCEGVREFIYQQGAVVMNTKNSHVFRRFVKNRSFCVKDRVLFRHNVPTRSGQCRLYICREPIDDE